VTFQSTYNGFSNKYDMLSVLNDVIRLSLLLSEIRHCREVPNDAITSELYLRNVLELHSPCMLFVLRTDRKLTNSVKNQMNAAGKC